MIAFLPACLRSTLALVALLGLAEPGDSRTPDATERPPREQFLVIPLRVHVLGATDLPEVDCGLTDADVARIVGKVNAIWHRAGIHWGLESLVREPAARQDAFRLARELNGEATLGLFRTLLPEASRRFPGLHVYFIHEFPVNGVYMGDDYAIVQETARLRPVEGGIDEPIPRVTAHELGHALGLSHRQDRTNLLASGTTGTLLNAEEIELARRGARKIRGVATLADLRGAAVAAAEAGDLARARRLRTWLADIPGDGADEDRRHLVGLDADTTSRPDASGK